MSVGQLVIHTEMKEIKEASVAADPLQYESQI